MQAGALCAVDLKEGEEPPAGLFLPSAEGCGAQSLAMLQKKLVLGCVVFEQLCHRAKGQHQGMQLRFLML